MRAFAEMNGGGLYGKFSVYYYVMPTPNIKWGKNRVFPPDFEVQWGGITSVEAAEGGKWVSRGFLRGGLTPFWAATF